ncbi:MAG TPA: hypothetical protein PLB96_10105 [Syntrophales bacterium]|nr:hypothetical protein [Syntrophales bacterium]
MEGAFRIAAMFQGRGWKTKMISQRNPRKNRQAGAALIVIIAAMTVVAILGAGMLGLFSSSIFSELFINNREKAYYLAQSGRQYAAMTINNLPAGDREAIDKALNGDLDDGTKGTGTTYILSDGSKFHLRSTTDDRRSYVESTGIVNEGTALETKQKIMFTVESKRFALDVFGVESVQLTNGAIIDSYDSSVGPYNAASNRSQKAVVRTNGTADGSINVVYKATTPCQIGGDAICGPCGPNLEYCDPNEDYGVINAVSLNPAIILITGTRTSASTTQAYSEVLAPGSCTSFYTCGSLLGDTVTVKIKGTNYTYRRMTGSGTATDPHTLATGVYRTNYFYFNGRTLTINGNVTLIVTEVFTNDGSLITSTGDVNMINASHIYIAPNATLDLYVLRTATFGQNCRINPPCRAGATATPCADGLPQTPATALRFLGITTTELFFNSQETYGGVSAPGASASFTAGSHFFGTVSARTIAMTGGGIHVDKAFSGTGGGTGAGNIVY